MKLKPILKPFYGCLNCGCREMATGKKEIRARMGTRIYGGFGGWTITRNGKLFYRPNDDLESEQYPTLMKFELAARKDPKSDWRAELNLPLRDATYQRQGKNRWVLVKSGPGFA